MSTKLGAGTVVAPARHPLVASTLVVLLITLAACRSLAQPAAPGTSATGIPVGSSTQTITVGNMARTFHLYRPRATSSRWALVVMLHGGFGSGLQAERSYGWDAESNLGHFIVVYPDGVDRAWNTGGGCCGVPAAAGIDDVAFITRMITAIEHEVPIDTRRIYATGISNGGIMAYTLACRTTLFAAIGPDSATQLGNCPSRLPASVIDIHGTADTRIPYEGGEGSGAGHIDGPSIPAVIGGWRQVDRCLPPVVTRQGIVATSLARCRGGLAVELVTIAGAGHQWPGSASHPIIEKLLGLDPPSTALDATKVIWQFFDRHPKPSS